MGNNLILGGCYLNLSLAFVLSFLCFCGYSSSYELQSGGPYNSFTVSSFSYPKTQLKPSEWRYIRVDLPPWFSSISVALESDVDINLENIQGIPTSRLPLICLRDGSPPVPDALNTSLTGLALGHLSNGLFGDLQGLQHAEVCYPMQKNISARLTNEQISAGIWYLGLFNGIGPTRTQSKMINRAPVYTFSGNISVDGCTISTLWGPYCNQTVDALLCNDNYNLTNDQSDIQRYNHTAKNVVLCRSSDLISCQLDRGPRVYFLDVPGIAEELTIMATNITFVESSLPNDTGNSSGITLMCYARLGAMPLASLYDYSANISNDPLIIRSPRVGRWYIKIHVVNALDENGGAMDSSTNICYSVNCRMLQCPEGKAGLNCTWETYMLQTVIGKNPSSLFESHFFPVTGVVSSISTNFPLEPLFSNSSEGHLDVAWTYFLLDVPYGAAGGHLHIQLTSEAKISYEIFIRYGGLPSPESWDHFYANTTSNSNGSMLLKLDDSNEKTIDFYILLVQGGTWGLGLKHPHPADMKTETTMSISLERCPRKCSFPHGSCQNRADASGLAVYSYCSCDRDHGGVDCSIEIVSRRGHIWQSVCLIASNAAAILPAYWALRQKAFAEWVLFTCSGISSGLYHACDVGTWCALSYHILQFMDFWLSFMAVVSTFIYLADIGEVSKRTIHTVVAILTALMAEAGPTRSANIVLVIAIGASGLLVGWLIELSSKFRPSFLPADFHLDILRKWEDMKRRVRALVKTLIKRFRWGLVLLAFTTLAMAAISWTLESSESYWIWHSVWHITIYTSSFLFLCSKVNVVDSENPQPPDGNYELTRQDSFPRIA